MEYNKTHYSGITYFTAANLGHLALGLAVAAGGGERWLKGLFWVTETVTAPWGIVTSVLLGGWFLWCLRFRLKPAIGLLVILSMVIVVGQGLKSLIKEQVQEPRPFVVWLEAEHHIDNHFSILYRVLNVVS